MKENYKKYPNGIDCVIPICDISFDSNGLITKIMEMDISKEEAEIIDSKSYDGMLISYIKSIALKKCNLKILQLIGIAENNFNKVLKFNCTKRKECDIIIVDDIRF